MKFAYYKDTNTFMCFVENWCESSFLSGICIADTKDYDFHYDGRIFDGESLKKIIKTGMTVHIIKKSAKPKKFWIFQPESGKPNVSFDSREKAEEVAKGLAERVPGKTFEVLEVRSAWRGESESKVTVKQTPIS